MIIIYAPIPLGANRIWASSSIEFLIFLAFIGHLFLSFKNDIPLFPPRFAKLILVPLVLTLVWLLIQMTPGLATLLSRSTHENINENINATLSLDPSLTHIMFLKTLAFTAFVWMIFCYVVNQSTLKRLAFTIIVTGLLQALYAIWLNLNDNSASPIFNFSYTNRANGSFVYANQLANYIALCLSIGIGILVSQLSLSAASSRLKQRVRDLAKALLSPKMIIRLTLIIMIIALILTRSRMGNSAFFIALATVSLYGFFQYKRKPRNLRLLIISFFVVDMILVGSIFGIEKVKERLIETSLSSETRDEVVRDSLPMIQDYWLTGTGGGSFYSSFQSYQPEYYSGFYDHAHNDYIQFMAEIGVPITLMLGAMMLYCLWIALATVRKRRTPLYQGVAFGCSIAIIHMLLHSTVDFSLQSPAIALLFLTILSMSVIAHHLSSRSRK